MGLFNDVITAARHQQGEAFDRRLAKQLVERYGIPDGMTAKTYVDWLGNRRLWLERFGVRAEQHISDHLTLMVVRGAGIVDHDDYRAIMTRPFLSQEEKAVRLRNRFLPVELDEMPHG